MTVENWRVLFLTLPKINLPCLFWNTGGSQFCIWLRFALMKQSTGVGYRLSAEDPLCKSPVCQLFFVLWCLLWPYGHLFDRSLWPSNSLVSHGKSELTRIEFNLSSSDRFNFRVTGYAQLRGVWPGYWNWATSRALLMKESSLWMEDER